MKKIFVKLIKLYQTYISAYTPANCRFKPTCSNYTKDAIEKFGAFKGCLMGASRILRCNPFVKSGYDPVPEKFSLKRNSKTEEEYRRLTNKE